MPVLFLTDALIFVLLAVVAVFVLYVRRREHLRAPWRHVARSRLAMISAVVLAAYIVIGVLDSIHFNPTVDNGSGNKTYSAEVLSVFDVLTTSLRERTEKTYSAPFATRHYVKETLELPDGQTTRGYSRLEFGGAHLQDPDSDRVPDILWNIVQASIVAALICAVLLCLLVAALSLASRNSFIAVFRNIFRKDNEIPWWAILLTTAAVIWFTVVIARLGVLYHVLGTDKVGQDVLYQALKSMRTGLVIGTLTTLVMLPFAILMGIMAGYFQNWIDDVIQFIYTTLSSVPGVLLIAAAILMLQIYMSNHAEDFTSIEVRSDMRLLFLCIILGITSWTGLCRILRGEALKLRESDYIQAAQAFGVGNGSIIVRHILPNVIHIVMITVVLDFSGLVLAEAVLSYVNIGVDPSMNSWGNMINSARLEMARDPVVWWSLLAAFFFMFTLVLSANLFSDAVRDAFDPRLR